MNRGLSPPIKGFRNVSLTVSGPCSRFVCALCRRREQDSSNWKLKRNRCDRPVRVTEKLPSKIPKILCEGAPIPARMSARSVKRDPQKWNPRLGPITLQIIKMAHDPIANPLTFWRIMRSRISLAAYGGRSRAAIHASTRYAASITASAPTTVRLPP